tara:strand:+ start:1309 stop:1617 length:309 start_codon:yes stop_codon:yes gene_type:complete
MDEIEGMTKPEAAKAVGELIGVEILDSAGGTVQKNSWTNVLAQLYLCGTGKGQKYRKLKKAEAAAAVGAILGVETVESNGSTITGDSWRNVLRELRQRHSDS